MDWGVFFAMCLGLGGGCLVFYGVIELGIGVGNRLFGNLEAHPTWFMLAWFFLFLVIPGAAVFAYFK